MDEINATLRFWFGEAVARGEVAPAQVEMWFQKNEDVDAIIRESFLEGILRAGRGELADWEASPAGALALILLCDQYARNAFRGTALSFALDFVALRVARESIEKGFDLQVGAVQRAFFYFPLEHAEDAALQALSVRQFEAWASGLPAELKPLGENFLAYAVRHREIVDQFGRFPHRNALLGRAPSAEEIEFLRQPNSGF